ncbi:MAG: hypothetical protein ACR2NH_11500 [Solirubrobacteraceae bacterium]
MDAKWSEEVGGIVEAAEAGALALREETERRAAERIAEADRAAAYRVEAAEAEALEVLAAAQTESARIITAAAEESERARILSAQTVRDLEDAARGEAERIQREADEYAALVRSAADQEARSRTAEPRRVAREVLDEGSQLSANLSELSVSMRNNSERLLRDVQAAHRQLTARLESFAPDAPAAAERPTRPSRSGTEGDVDLDVPEFIP